MIQRQQRCEVLIRVVLIGPRVNMGWRNDNAGISLVFEPIDKVQRCFFKHRERQFIVVILVAFVPALDPRSTARIALPQNDHPPGVMFGNFGRFLREIGWRVFFQNRPVGDADEVDAEFTRFRLYDCRRERRLECRYHYIVVP